MHKPRVFVTGKVLAKGLDILRDSCELLIIEDPNPEDLNRQLINADGVLHKIGKLTPSILDKSRNLKIVARHGVGLDDVDIPYLRQKNIWLTTTGGANSNAVAEHTMSMIFAATRNLIQAHISLSVHRKWIREQFMGEEVAGKLLGIVGYGRIGKRLARLAVGCGMDVVVYDPQEARDPATLFVDNLEEMLPKVDFLAICCPLNDTTRGIIGKIEIDALKPSAFILNTARGGIVDEHALYEALNENKIRGACLDVFAGEPGFDPDNPLLGLNNIIVTPHIAAMTIQAQEKMAIMAAQEIKRCLVDSERPYSPLWDINI